MPITAHSGRIFRTLVDQLPLAVWVFNDDELVYVNAAADHLAQSMPPGEHAEVQATLRTHAARGRTPAAGQGKLLPRLASVVTTPQGERFSLNVIPIAKDGTKMAVTLRAAGIELDALGRKYKLSRRESEVAQLLLQGYRNSDIATTLGISQATAKKHVSHILGRVGVDTRTQLIARLV